MRAVFRKEFRSYFTSPIGYVVLAFIYFFGGFSFFAYNMTYGYISLQYVFQSLYSILLLLVLPILTMRLFSDEKRQKTDQVLFTAPTSLTSIVLGKFFAALLLYVIGIGITLLLILPLNAIIHHLSGLSGVAALPAGAAVILVAISMLLTFLAGLIPSRIAAKKDPVIALRSE